MRDGWGRMPWGLLSGFGYAALYLGLRQTSMDQWYLPAGLRFVALMTLPRRYWPFLFVAEVGAVLSLTLPLADKYGRAWALLSPLVTFPPVAAIVHCVRRRTCLPIIAGAGDTYWFSGAAVASALASTAVNKTLGALLMGGAYSFSIDRSLVYLLGEYLGILMVAVPALLAIAMANARRIDRALLTDLLRSVPAFAMFGVIALMWSSHSGRPGSLGIIVLLPAVWLTIRRGWAGGALGAWVANLCVALALDGGGVVAAVDGDLLGLQLVTAIFATVLISVGAKISHEVASSTASASRADQAMGLARIGFGYSEEALRDLRVALGRRHLQSWTPHFVGSEPPLTPRTDLDAIYPMQIEDFGLFAAIGAPTFSRPLTDAGIELRPRLVGDTRLLSNAARHSIYRLAHDAIRHLVPTDPDAVQLTIKIHDGEMPRVSLVALAVEPRDPSLAAGRIDSMRARALAFGAVVRAKGPRVYISMYDQRAETSARADASA